MRRAVCSGLALYVWLRITSICRHGSRSRSSILASPLQLPAESGIATRTDIKSTGGVCSLLFLAMLWGVLGGCGGVRITLVGVWRLLARLLEGVLAVAIVGARHGELGRATRQQREFVMGRCARDAALARETVAEMLGVCSVAQLGCGSWRRRLAGAVQGGGWWSKAWIWKRVAGESCRRVLRSAHSCGVKWLPMTDWPQSAEHVEGGHPGNRSGAIAGAWTRTVNPRLWLKRTLAG